jgi:glycosyltransferase involved in cell wall biosynthesis
MKNKLVSILIPVYNRETFIEETVKSALNQTYANIEVIVVDNKSTDNTLLVIEELALEDKRIKIYQNETNIGPVQNWKRCVDEARGEYGKILFSDDLMEPSFLEATIDYLKDESIGFVFTGREIFQDNEQKTVLSYMAIAETGIYLSSKFINGVLFEKNYPNSPACALFRLKDLQENLLIDIPNNINSDFAMHGIGPDLLIFLITASKYKKFAFINKRLVRFRAHSESITIISKGSRLLLMYAIAKAFFIEKYLDGNTNILEKYNGQLQLLILQYESRKFRINNISDFYLKNKNYNFDKMVYLEYALIVLKKIIKKLVGKK